MLRPALLITVIFTLGCAESAAQDIPPLSLPLQVGNELTVLAPTIAPEELDRVVLNRLLLELSREPVAMQERLGIDAQLLEEVQVSLANASGFINDNEMANIRAMCEAWKESAASDLQATDRIALALDAYKARRQFTRDFIARFYRIVILEIESFLPEPAVLRFNDYLNDRRRRLANAGNVVAGAVVENVSSGAETVRFHCRSD